MEDPETGEVIGRGEDQVIGQAGVERTDRRVARLVATSGQRFQKLDVVRIAAAK